MDKKWWKESVMYQVYPRSFQDSNSDGIGDIRGIIKRIEHFVELGVDLIWLGPVYDSPNDDNGYDIRDYRKIHSDFGTMEDFEELLSELHKNGIRLIMDLVVNHSSDEHFWFKESRKSKDNPYRDYYYWRDGKEGSVPNNFESFFGGSTWEWDEKTQQYYLHLFTKKQPDLNWENPCVREEVYDIMRFWLDKGIDGFRMDVISLISKRLPFSQSNYDDINQMIEHDYANGPRIHEFLTEMYEKVLCHYDVMTVGEGPGISKAHALDYIGQDRNELNMIFQLELMFLGFGKAGRYDYQPYAFTEVKRTLVEWDAAIGDQGWNNVFFDNHDFPRMVSRFGNDGPFRIQSAKMLAMMLLTLRGTPCIYMGSEMGMTNVNFDSIDDYDDVETLNFYKIFVEEERRMTEREYLDIVSIQGRDNVRTPIQWNAGKNAGFTEGKPWIKVNPNFKEINLENDLAHSDSIFRFYKDLIAYRKANPDLVYADFESLDPEHESVFIYRRQGISKTYIIVLNFSDELVNYPLPFDVNGYRIAVSNLAYASSSITRDLALNSWQGLILEKQN